ncbi:MAG: metalloregulator ArsR/SmtB family transcription factor [Gracilimonas sp.]
MPADQLSSTFHALADPTRRAILSSLTTGEKTVSDLAEPFDMSMPAITKHLKVLEKAKLIERSKQAQYRPCRLHPEPLKDIDEWIEQYRKFFEASFDRLEDYLQQIQTKGNHDDTQ